MAESMAADRALTGTAYLWIFNWTPWNLYLELNGADDPSNPLLPSTVANGYFPYYDNHYPRDLSLYTGTATKWGQSNRLVVNFAEVSQRLVYSELADPGAITTADVYLWVFPSSVVFSQQSSFLKEVMPD